MIDQRQKASGLLLDLADLAVGFDQSWSFGTTEVDRRALFFLPPTPEAQAALLAAATALGFDEPALARFHEFAPGCDAIGMALSQSGSVRLYLQYWNRVVARVLTGDLTPAPLYTGIKRWPGGEGREDSYICHPLAPEPEWHPKMAAAMAAFGCAASEVDQFLAPLTPENAIWTTIQNPQRQSWLMSLHRAEPDAATLIRALEPVAQREGVSEIIAALHEGSPLHLAGGDDGRKGQFLSLYVECDRSAMLRFINSCPWL